VRLRTSGQGGITNQGAPRRGDLDARLVGSADAAVLTAFAASAAGDDAALAGKDRVAQLDDGRRG
jgi:hypothetical protein